MKLQVATRKDNPMNEKDRDQKRDRFAVNVARAVQCLSWMGVGLCAVLIAVGVSVSEDRAERNLLSEGQPALAQAGGAPADAVDGGAVDGGEAAADGGALDKAAGGAADGGVAGADGGGQAADGGDKAAEGDKAPEGEVGADGAAAGAEGDKAAGAGDEGPSAQGGAQAPPKLRNPMRESEGMEGFMGKAVSFLGIFVFIFLSWLMSNNRKKVDWKLVIVGTVLQVVFAAMIFWMPYGRDLFDLANDGFNKLLGFTNEGSKFLFGSFVSNGEVQPALINFTFMVLPTIIFFSSLMTVLYHLGIMQIVVKSFAWVMVRLMGTSGAETLSASANIFVGQTEAPLVVKPFIDKMTMSELMTVMTGGFATVAGGVMAAYVGMLSGVFPEIAGHLIAASVMSAPAALVIGKIVYPETEVPVTMGTLKSDVEKVDANVIEAAARGAGEGLQLALNVAAMLLAFVALIAMLNYLLGAPSTWYNTGSLNELVEYFTANKLTIPEGCVAPADSAVIGCVNQMKELAGAGAPDVSTWHVLRFEEIFGYLFWPVALAMGVPPQDCYHIGQLLGTKMVLNEFVAYINLAGMLNDPEITLSRRSVVIATYALCGFANFGSIAIQIGGLGAIAPSRRKDLARLGLRAMIAGSIAAFMTATIAGILV